MTSKKSAPYKRKVATKDFRKKILIVTEGKTEKEYFDEFKRMPQLTVITHDGQDNKRSLVEKAISLRNEKVAAGEMVESDQTWAVFDRDIDIKNKLDKDNFNQALDVATQNDIRVAYSNDAVELWFLLHYQEVTGEIPRTDLNTKLSAHIGESYKKAQGKKMYDLTKEARATAILRAKRLLKQAAKTPPCDANPSTTVHVLVEELISSGFREKK